MNAELRKHPLRMTADRFVLICSCSETACVPRPAANSPRISCSRGVRRNFFDEGNRLGCLVLVIARRTRAISSSGSKGLVTWSSPPSRKPATRSYVSVLVRDEDDRHAFAEPVSKVPADLVPARVAQVDVDEDDVGPFSRPT
jgi:hypothetical protein